MTANSCIVDDTDFESRKQELETLRNQNKATSDQLLDLGLLCEWFKDDYGQGKYLKILHEAFTLDPGNGLAKLHWCALMTYSPLVLGSDQFGRGNREKVVKILTEILTKHEEYEGAAYYSFYLLLSNGEESSNNAVMIDYLERSINLEPDWVGNRLNLSGLYSQEGRCRDAFRQATTALTKFNLDQPRLDLRGWYYEYLIVHNTSTMFREFLLERLVKLHSLIGDTIFSEIQVIRPSMKPKSFLSRIFRLGK